MQTEINIYERIRMILSKRFKIEIALITEAAHLEDDLGLDSIELMDAVCLAEAEFKIKILKKGQVNIPFPETVHDLAVLVSQRMNT